MADVDWDKLLPMIEKVAHNVARRNPGVEKDDLYSALCEFAVKATQPHLKHPLDPEQEAGCNHILYRAAAIEARQLRAEAYANVTQYDYCTDDVKRILPYALGDPERWPMAPSPDDDPITQKIHASRMDGVIDILEALEYLGPGACGPIYEKYLDGVEHAAGTAGRQRLNRAIQKVARGASIARHRRVQDMETVGYPGSRESLSNAQARRLIERDATFEPRVNGGPVNEGWA